MEKIICPNTTNCPFYKEYRSNRADEIEGFNQVDVIRKEQSPDCTKYVCEALDSHQRGPYQPNPELERRLEKEDCQCAIIELLNNSI